MNYKNIMVVGSGVLGSQIAFQTAYKGFQVNVYDISDQALSHAKERLTRLKETTRKTYAPPSKLWMRLFTAYRFTLIFLKLSQMRISRLRLFLKWPRLKLIDR